MTPQEADALLEAIRKEMPKHRITNFVWKKHNVVTLGCAECDECLYLLNERTAHTYRVLGEIIRRFVT
jgi:hypothetical protein